MKKMILSLMAMLTVAVSASAMSYEQARNDALFLTDTMAYELNLTDAQYEAAYEINLDYLMGVTSQYDVFGPYWERRNLDLSYILYSWQWDLYRAATYFYRPLFFDAGYWHFGIYARYPHRDYFYFGRPAFYISYRGGHSWRMNGGRSFYEGRRDHYRPEHRSRDQHFGMRNGWDRGDYRGGNPGSRPSSTHVTGSTRFNDRPNNDGERTLHVGGSRSGGQQGGFGSGRFGGNVNDRQNNNGMGERPQGGVGTQGNQNGVGSQGDRPTMGGSRSGGAFDGTRSSGTGTGTTGGPSVGTSRSNGSFGGSRPNVTPTQPSVAPSRPNVVSPSRTTVTPSQPSVTTSRPSVTTSRPSVTTSRPSVTTSRPSITTSRPSVTTSRPSVTTSRPSGGSTTRSAGSVGGGRSGGSNSHGSFGGSRR